MIKINVSTFMTVSILLLNPSKIFATESLLLSPIQPTDRFIFKNKNYHFSFSMPSDWEKQSGHINGSNVLFMQIPIANSCRFQFNVIPMTATFQAESVVNHALTSAYRILKLNKLAAVKQRYTLLKEKIAVNGKIKEQEKVLILTRGWEISEKPQHLKQQRIIYQVYDRENRYFNFTAAASSEKFAQCEPELRKIIDSITFTLL